VKVTGEQQELNRPFDQVKTQIANKLFREKKTKEFDEWLKKLREDAKITVDDKALEAIEVSAGPAPVAGAPGAPHGMAGAVAAPVAPAPAPAAPAAPAPAPAPAAAPTQK
jgi:peptidyl-prolyl cis-trans isomerase C